MAVTPVRTGPRPGRSGPAGPRMMVEWPTRTPSTSVMAFHFPGLKRPSGMPSSRARWRCSTTVLYPDFCRNAISLLFERLDDVLRRQRWRNGRRAVPVDRPPSLGGPGLGPALALPLLVPADRSGEDLRDQRVVLDARRLRDQHQVAPTRSQSGERIALEEVDLPLSVHAEVDPGHVPAAEGDEALAGRALQPLDLRRLQPGGHVVAARRGRPLPSDAGPWAAAPRASPP